MGGLQNAGIKALKNQRLEIANSVTFQEVCW